MRISDQKDYLRRWSEAYIDAIYNTGPDVHSNATTNLGSIQTVGGLHGGLELVGLRITGYASYQYIEK